MASSYVECTGAYGRHYNTLKEAKVDWEAGKDFRSTTGPYLNKEDAIRMNLNVVLRFGKNNEKLGTLRK